MQAHLVRNLKGKLLFLGLISAIVMISIKSSLQNRRDDQDFHNQPLIHSPYLFSNISRFPTRRKQTSFALDDMENDLSYLENNIFYSASYESSLDESSYETNAMINVSTNGTTSESLPSSFVVDPITNQFQHGCYSRGTIKGKKELLPPGTLEELGCKQRPPEAIVFGVKKGGSTTLKEFLAFHPGVSVAPKELKFLNNKKLVNQGIKQYASMMPYSLPEQIPIEKTPGYLVRQKCAEPLKEMIPDCKLIAILSDPVRRAISDFVHLSWVRDNRKGGASELLPKHANQMPHYEVKATFEESVLYPNGSIKTWNTLLDTGVYYKHAKFWLQYFPSDNFFYIDSDDLVHNPVKAFKELEQFLGLAAFFSDSVFHYNKTKGFYCVQYPIYSCMPDAKGRPHPVVDEAVIQKLQDYFEPYNKQFSELVNRTFSWTSYSTGATGV